MFVNNAADLFRCAQEVVTNAVRHSSAKNLWLATRVAGGTLQFVARDDGTGATTISPGNGLRGIRERIASHNGQVEIENVWPRGFSVLISVPIASLEVS